MFNISSVIKQLAILLTILTLVVIVPAAVNDVIRAQYQGSNERLEATLEFGWILYSRQIDDSNYRVLIVSRSEAGYPSTQCRYNATNTSFDAGIQISAPMQRQNGDITYDIFIERTVEEAAGGVLDSLRDSSVEEIFNNLGNADLSDLAITDIHGSIIIPNFSTENQMISPPSIVC